MSTDRIGAEALRAYAAQILRAHRIDEDQVRSVAHILIWSELVGRENFGLGRLPIHIERVRRGRLNPVCRPAFQSLAETMELLDGDNGFGHYIGELGMGRAVALARRHGVGIVGVRDSNFFGAGAYFVDQAARAGMIGLAMSNSFPKVAAHGGIRPVFGTNPFAFGAPRRNGESLMVDMATSALAGSSVRAHADRHEPLPVGMALDADGQPITDPAKVADGTLLPFGGAKGYGLALLVEVLAGVITGAGVSHGVASMYQDFSAAGHNGHFLMALDIARWLPVEHYYERFESLIDTIRASHPNEEVLLPGEIRWRNHQDNAARGIRVAGSLRDALRALSEPHGIEPPWDNA